MRDDVACNRLSALCFDSVLPQRDTPLQTTIDTHLPELAQLERILADVEPSVHWRVEAEVDMRGEFSLPIYSLDLGNRSPESPVLILTAGLHGVERIGSEVLLGFLASLFERMQWDKGVAALLQQVHLVVVPIVNPGGMLLRTRANPRGVDLNRNAPIAAEVGAEQSLPWLACGQRLSRYLPWYRGRRSEPMELENQVLQQVVARACLGRKLAISLDIHSGYGCQDRIWIPYAFRAQPIDCLPEMLALKDLWQSSCPHHNYHFEPQSKHYLAHGDMWDYLHQQLQNDLLFLPLTLELGSWNWLRKRPRQLFNRLGLFHPLVPHRLKRAVRDHQSLLQFLMSAAASWEAWLPLADQREQLLNQALIHWYDKH